MAVAPGSALGYLRTRSLVDCDTLDAKGTLLLPYEMVDIVEEAILT